MSSAIRWIVCGGLVENEFFKVVLTDVRIADRGGGKASSAGPEGGWESETRSLEGEENRGTGGGRKGVWF